ncbi:MAG: hypothetical protein A2Z25_06260 [Planctomycetes bacterium RBG_16_55_9]|nr:MAG: hypothetical protein A2Z25_06260 [Planctomycetes bacterium RBG_16_55_9]
MWLCVGLAFIVMGYHIHKETAIGIVLIIVGSISTIGSLLLKKVVVVFDKNANTVTRYWKAWIGISKKAKSIPIDGISSIVYEREVTFASANKTGIKQKLFLFAEVNDDSRFYFIPITYTPRNAKEKGNQIANFLIVPFKIEETKTESTVRRNRRQDEK